MYLRSVFLVWLSMSLPTNSKHTHTHTLVFDLSAAHDWVITHELLLPLRSVFLVLMFMSWPTNSQLTLCCVRFILMRKETELLGQNPWVRLRTTETKPKYNDGWGGRWNLSPLSQCHSPRSTERGIPRLSPNQLLTPSIKNKIPPQSLFQSNSKCEIFVMVISSNVNVNENWYS